MLRSSTDAVLVRALLVAKSGLLLISQQDEQLVALAQAGRGLGNQSATPPSAGDGADGKSVFAR